MSSCLPLLMLSVSQEKTLHTNMEPDPVANKNVCWSTGSPKGWMLVVSRSSRSATTATAWLWNPRTKGKIHLPDIEEHDIPTMGSKCSLTHRDATHPECIVKLIDYTQPNFWYCKVKGGGWSHFTLDVSGWKQNGGAGFRVTTLGTRPCSSSTTHSGDIMEPLAKRAPKGYLH